MPKIVDHDKYRKELLHRSLDIFAQRGFGQVKMRDLAQALDVSTGSLYNYFPNKEKMFDQLVKTLSGEDLEKFSAVVESKKTLADKFEALTTFIRENESLLLKQTVLAVDFCRQHPELQGKNEAIKLANEQYERFAEHHLGADQALAQMISCLLTGLIVERFVQGNRISIKSVLRTVAKLVAQAPK